MEQGGVPREQIAGEEARVETKPRGGETSSKVAREGAPRGAGRKAGALRGATPPLQASGRVSCALRLLVTRSRGRQAPAWASLHPVSVAVTRWSHRGPGHESPRGFA